MKKDKRMVILDLGNCASDEISGKDLAETNCPSETLKEISQRIKFSKCRGYPAEEEFVMAVKSKGFDIQIIDSLENISVVNASADSY